MGFEHFKPTISELARYGNEYFVTDNEGRFVQNIYTGDSDNDKNICQLLIDDRVVMRYLDDKDFDFFGFKKISNEPGYKVFITKAVDILNSRFHAWIELHLAGSELIVDKIVEHDDGTSRYTLFRGDCKTKYDLEWIVRATFFEFMYLTTLKGGEYKI